jgi:hypothetical protein
MMKYIRLKWWLFGRPSYIERKSEESVTMLENLVRTLDYLENTGKGDKDLMPLKPETEEYARRKLEELRGMTPILLFVSQRRLERLTRWLILLTAILSVLTALLIITRL